MHSSELSNALNPYISQSRPQPSAPVYVQQYEPIAQPPPSQYVPHRSELELAISEPPPPPPQTIATTTTVTRQPSSANVQAVQELLRIVAATRESQEIERKRRLAWEQEQEAKYTQRQAELERLVFEMRQEISTLRSNANAKPSAAATGLITPQHHLSPPLAVQRPPQPASPISPVFQVASSSYAFVQGSSNQPLPGHQPYHDDFQMPPQPEITSDEPPIPAITPSPSPQLTFVQPSQLHHEVSVSPVNRRKRQTPELSSDEEGNSSDSSSSNNGPPLKRVNHHDKRCLTIHHALREHMLRVMQLEHDKELPDSHAEGVPIGPNDPVRFVWDKTTKQSVHNARMKARVIADIKANRRLYKHVPDKDFGKKILDAAFDASFVTFRQKFKAQRDEALALHHKKREEAKAQKARHMSRKKIKLSNRADSRLKVDAFQHVTFDGALQLECMSSEESDQEGPRSSGMLRTRGYLWRSTRLKRFYSVLDNEEKVDKSSKPKRGSGKRERCTGPPKEGFHLPPQGVATWMISRQWINATQLQYPDLPDALSKLVLDPPGFDWDQFDALGEESDVSGDELQTIDGQHPYLHSHHHAMLSSSLNYALV
ncbi:hypothetical protein Hypma_010034 [Hypsizygus marmoreus]|uniref:Uncharacterized protein n=1 Tax=Hypsizygus marmoreus TaxID=39966 RepID=A0A369JK14_HYPMA|nr:hypothetical protein Hypma_010034 [Hypsizygus marmoreus]